MLTGFSLNSVVRERLSEVVAFEQTLERSEGANHMDIWRQRVPRRGHGKCRDLEMGMYIRNAGRPV